MKQNNEVAVFTTNDLVAAGINTQLSSNDLIEVIAHDIYDKFIETVNKSRKASDDLSERWHGLFDAELNTMKQQLKSGGHISEDENEKIDESFRGEKTYWTYSVSLKYLSIYDKDKGTKVEERSNSLGYAKGNTIIIRLNVNVNEYDKDKEISLSGISGSIETTIKKQFEKTITSSDLRFTKMLKEIKEHNENVSAIMKFLPANGILSVERFTREARVKMNKKIISAQSPEFRKKISELFNIKL